MEEKQKDLVGKVQEYYCCPGCGKAVDFSEVEKYKKTLPENLMDMELIKFFETHSKYFTGDLNLLKHNKRRIENVLYALRRGYPEDSMRWSGRKENTFVRKVKDIYTIDDSIMSNLAYTNQVDFGAKTLAKINETLTENGLPTVPRSKKPYSARTLYSGSDRK